MKKAPSYTNPPATMDPGNLDTWKFVVNHYADDIYESKSLRDQWRKAKSHFERVCNLKGVHPYAVEECYKESSVSTLVSLAERLERISRSR